MAFYDSRRLSSLTQPSGDFVVKARAISAAWNMGDPITVQSSSFGDCFGQDLAGSTGEDDSAYATWRAPNGNGAVELRVGRIRVDSDMKVGNFGQIAISTGTDTSFGGGGSIARTGGPTGRYLIAWTKDNSIRGTVIGPGLARLGGSFAIQTFDGEFRTAPKVDGDGTSWLVAYSRSEGNSRSSYDAVCRRVTFDEPRGRAHVEGDEIGVAQRAGFNEFCRDIARLGDSYLLVIEDHQAPVLLSLDPANCSRCEGRFRLDSSIRKSLPMAVATPQTGGSIPNRRRSLVVWADPDTDPNLRGQFFEEADGAIKNLGGGCGSAGENLASCARVARSAFSYRLRYADSNTTAFLMLGFEQITLSCGGCTMMVNPMASLRTTTDGWGSASVNVPVPNYPSLHGLEVLGQWAFIDQGRTCMDQIDVSDALSVRIEG